MISVYTKDETQRQSLLHFIQDHIAIHPGQSKANLNRDSITFRVYFLIILELGMYLKTVQIHTLYRYFFA